MAGIIGGVMQGEEYLEYASDVAVAPWARWRGIFLIQVIQGVLVVGALRGDFSEY